MAHRVLLEFVYVDWPLRSLNLFKFLLPYSLLLLTHFLEALFERFVEWFAIILNLSNLLFDHLELLFLLLLLLFHQL